MENLLLSFYRGELEPVEKYRPVIEEHLELRKKQIRHYDSFKDKLDPDLAEEFMEIMDEQLEEAPLENAQAYIDGFRMGARMMMEILDQKDDDE